MSQILRTPATRKLLQPILPRLATTRTYYSYETPLPPPYPPTETAILSSALSHVPTTGWTNLSLRNGARDAGYLDVSTNLFPKAEFELVLYHLRTQRLGLKDRVQFPEETALGATRKVKSLVMERIRGNVEVDVQQRWQEALGLMSLAGNIPSSLRELFLLADEIWFLAGDDAVDMSWYTKRATLSSVYAATETYSTTDQSTDFKDTEEFLDRRLEEARAVGGAWRNVNEWLGFQRMATVNMARNWGVRI
ncbi:ubiquinone biosynthesis protein COQ9 [Aureobasidium sp. EXF-12298]|nr:ubiquinone biosynthesis protein COQ9 [Aureobasidium sp. EXF-12298]